MMVCDGEDERCVQIRAALTRKHLGGPLFVVEDFCLIQTQSSVPMGVRSTSNDI